MTDSVLVTTDWLHDHLDDPNVPANGDRAHVLARYPAAVLLQSPR